MKLSSPVVVHSSESAKSGDQGVGVDRIYFCHSNWHELCHVDGDGYLSPKASDAILHRGER